MTLTKIAFIVLRLIPESETIKNENIEKEISQELANTIIPWVKEIVKVSVLECLDHE